MNKITFILSSFILVLLASCEKDEEIINNIILPEETSEALVVDVNLVEGAQILIDWHLSSSIDSEGVAYSVFVNDNEKATNISESKLIIDATEFKSSPSSTKVVLDILINAVNGSGETFTFDVTKVVVVNADPIGLNIENISVNYLDLEYFRVDFIKAIDLDQDVVTYDFYINDELIQEDVRVLEEIIVPTNYIYNGYDYVPQSYIQNEYYGTVILAYDVASIESEDTTLKIVAKDHEGGTNEVTETFNLNKTDTDLGPLTLPYVNDIDFEISSDEIDGRIRYSFEITEEAVFQLLPDNGIDVIIRNSNNEIINTYSYDYSYGYNKGELSSGSYTLELINEYSYERNSGTVFVTMISPNATDVSLDTVPIPYESEFAVNFTNEIDGEINYSFEITEAVGYVFSLDTPGYYMTLLNANGGVVLSDSYNQVLYGSYDSLPAGKYTLKMYSNSSYPEPEEIMLTMVLKETNQSDEILGLLSTPYENTINIDFNFEPDNLVTYTFEVDKNVGYSIYSSNNDVEFIIKDRFDNIVKEGYSNELKSNGADLIPGSYQLEVRFDSYSYYNSTNREVSFDIFIDTENTSDEQLGVLTAPLEAVKPFDFKNEFDDAIVYTFEITSTTNYEFITGFANVYMYLRNGDDSFYYYQSGSKEISGELSPGTYVLSLSDNTYSSSSKGELILTLTEN